MNYEILILKYVYNMIYETHKIKKICFYSVFSAKAMFKSLLYGKKLDIMVFYSKNIKRKNNQWQNYILSA